MSLFEDEKSLVMSKPYLSAIIVTTRSDNTEACDHVWAIELFQTDLCENYHSFLRPCYAFRFKPHLMKIIYSELSS